MMLSYKVELQIVALQFLNEYFSKVFLIHSYTDFLTSRGHNQDQHTLDPSLTFPLYIPFVKVRLRSKASSFKFYSK